MSDWKAAMGADPIPQPHYSTNGHRVMPPHQASNVEGGGNSKPDHAEDKLAGMITMQLAPNEAALISNRRYATFSHDPLRPAESLNGASNGEPTVQPEWIPVPISQLTAEGEAVPWLWGGYIASGYKTSFTGLWKSGKTTLLKHLLKSMDGSATEFCGLPVVYTKVLVVSEESKRLWAGRRDEVGLSDNVHLITLPFRTRPQLAEWTAFVAHLAALKTKEGYDLIVFDSMHNLWGVTDENKNAEVLGYLTPLNSLTEQEAAVLLIAHPSKGDSGEGRATRGGGAWGGFVDLILEMRRHDPDNRDDTRRVLTAYSRSEETPPQLVIELDKAEHKYRVVGTKADAHAQDRMSVYVAILPKSDPGRTPEEIREAWPEGEIVRPSIKTITRDLDEAVSKGDKVRCTGAGRKGDPKRYSILDTIEA